MSTEPITHWDDVIDSRDVIARIEELSSRRLDDDDNIVPDALDDDELAELDALTELAREGAGSSDWEYGETLIRDSYFEDYAQELAHDCGMVAESSSWPNYCIDWERAARELQVDYTPLDYHGVTYWIRSC